MIEIKVSKNPEVNRLLASFALLLAGLLIAALLLALAGRYYLKQVILENYASFAGAVAENYPEAEGDLIRSLLHPDRAAARDAAVRGRDILSKYGIGRGNPDLETPLMQNLFYHSLITYLLLTFSTAAAFAAAALLFLRKQYGQIRGVTRYAGEISRGDYSLEIRDNREGDLSILKNEIYKITTLLKEQAGALQQEKELLADSLADISHQLKTPLTSLSVLNDLLSDNPEEENRTLFLERMRAQLQRIEWLVSSLLKLSRLDAGAVTMKKERIPAGVLVQKALTSLVLPLEIKALDVRLAGDEGACFTGDPEWSHEALVNIIKNCIEHTPERGRLQISFEGNPIYTAIRVADSGAGIAPGDLPHIFERFYKGKNAAPDQVGIGLAMARAIVEKQSGDITVKSDPDRGSEFTIKFYGRASQ